jgi:hypothetical protein
MWSEQGQLPHQITSGHPTHPNSSAAVVLAYDIPHRIPWDWRLSLYTWTKGIAAGAYLLPLLFVLCGLMSPFSPLWRWTAPIVAGFFLALTGAILIADLEHPERFYFIFTQRQWQSWLVRGAFIIAGYSGVLALHFLASFPEEAGQFFQRALMVAGLPLSMLTARIRRIYSLKQKDVISGRVLSYPHTSSSKPGLAVQRYFSLLPSCLSQP